MLKNAFRPVEEAAMAFDVENCCTAIGKKICYFNKNSFRPYSKLVYSESRNGFYCKYRAIFSTSLVNCGIGKNCQKPGKLVIEFFCSLIKLTGSDEYLYEHDRLECHKSMAIEIR